MAERLPILLFPKPSESARESLPPGWPSLHVPNGQRQAERLGPKFKQLEAAAESRRLQLSTDGVEADPDFVLVLETVGTIDKFLTAVKRTSGLEWLLESDELDVDPDDDFHGVDKFGNPQDAVLPGRLFLLGTNRSALLEVIKIWNAYKQDPAVVLPHGMRKWVAIFSHLKDVRFWAAADRLPPDVKQYWQERIDFGEAEIAFEIEAWCFASDAKNADVAVEVKALVAKSGGTVLASALITEISYHGFLVRMPRDTVAAILSATPPELVLSEHIMHFRPRGQSLASPASGDLSDAIRIGETQIQGPPIAALFDGLPMQNHPLLQGRLLIDDPDNFEADYQAQERLHGTAMASLITLGELDGSQPPSVGRPLYVRPIMKPDPSDSSPIRAESTPNDRLLIDLVHQSVRRLFEGEAIAPTIKVINLSVGDFNRQFDRTLSPWARLIDWLSAKYQVLFVISTGNDSSSLSLDTGGVALQNLAVGQRQSAVVTAMLSMSRSRALLAPAESVNSLTVGAAHADSAVFQEVPGRWDLLPTNSMACYSRGGRGFRRAIKPEILMPGGRALRSEAPVQQGKTIEMRLVNGIMPPGQRVATVPVGGKSTRYSRGTSNAAALATRAVIQIHAMLDSLREGAPDLSSGAFDAVLLKALLVHGAKWGDLRDQVINAIDVQDGRHIPMSVASSVGYGLADVERSLGCTEQRATLLGVGELSSDQGMEFEAPLPPCLIAQKVKRRLTLTLAWFTPTSTRHAKYRTARLWVFPPHEVLRATRVDCDWRDVKRGTVQHEIFEGDDAFAFVDGDVLRFKVNCAEDAGKITTPVRFALCVTIEVAEGVAYPIYQEVSQRIRSRTQVTVA